MIKVQGSADDIQSSKRRPSPSRTTRDKATVSYTAIKLSDRDLEEFVGGIIDLAARHTTKFGSFAVTVNTTRRPRS